MHTKEIPREKWGSFLDGFTRDHEKWRISVELMTPDLGAQTQMHEMPLVGISAENNGGENAIAIIAGDDAGQTTHFVQNPDRVWLELSDQGTAEALEIESPNGIKTLIRVRADLQPANR